MTNTTPISRRSMLAGLAAAAVAAPALADVDLNLAAASVADQASERPRAILMWLDTVPAWRGPGLYEVDYVDGPRIVFIEPDPRPLDNQYWFRASEWLADRSQRGSWSMPDKSLALMNIRKVGDIG